MKKYLCPKCSLPSFTAWQKLGLGPLKKIRCQSCSAFVSVPWISSFVVITLANVFAFAVSLVVFIWVGTLAGVLALVFCAVAFLWIYQRFVPLIEKNA